MMSRRPRPFEMHTGHLFLLSRRPAQDWRLVSHRLLPRVDRTRPKPRVLLPLYMVMRPGKQRERMTHHHPLPLNVNQQCLRPFEQDQLPREMLPDPLMRPRLVSRAVSLYERAIC